jgi:phosphatidylserine/phosphatidylglycerophosphate/cardiolipin synthase-like enzyme
MRKRSLLLTVVLAVSMVGFVAPSASAWEPAGAGTFNVPKPWGGKKANYRIVNHVERAIDRAQGPTKKYPSPTIHISTFLLDRKSSVSALVRACRRGISVRVILDRDIDNKNSRRLIRVLNGDNVRDRNGDGKADTKPKTRRCGKALKKKAGRLSAPSAEGPSAEVPAGEEPTVEEPQEPMTQAQLARSVKRPTKSAVTWGKDRSYVKRCAGSCRGGGGNMHSKFFLFSRTGTARHVVMVSSSNLNKGGAQGGWNDLYTIKNRPVTHRGYARIHRDMTDDRKAGDKKVEVKDGRYVSRFFPMKNGNKKSDPTLKDLQAIQCRSDLGRTRIHISMFYWKGKRGNYLASALLNLARAGCKVSIVYGAPSLEIAERLRKAADRRLINLWDSRWDRNKDGYSEVRTHAKYVLVRGNYRGDRTAHMVMTGSQNWVAGSLMRSDEVTLNVNGRAAYRDYLKNWKNVRKHSRRLPYSRYR